MAFQCCGQRFRYLIILILFLLFVLGVNAQAVHSDGTHMDLPVLIDGSKTPELISDELAYRHFILALAEHKNLSAEENRRRASRLAPINLPSKDAAAIVNALAGLRERLDQIDLTRASLEPKVHNADTLNGQKALDDSFLSLKQQEDIILESSRKALRAALSGEGLQRFDSYIRETVKRSIVVYGY